MYQEKQLLVAELKSPPAEEVSHGLFLSSLINSVEWKFGDDMKCCVKWAYRLPYHFLVLVDNENITRKLASEVSTELKLNHSQSEHTIEVCFSLLTDTTNLVTEYLLVGCDEEDTTLLLDLPYDILTSLQELTNATVPSLVFTRCGSIV